MNGQVLVRGGVRHVFTGLELPSAGHYEFVLSIDGICGPEGAPGGLAMHSSGRGDRAHPTAPALPPGNGPQASTTRPRRCAPCRLDATSVQAYSG
jgi:hypothetical protein